MRKNNKRLLYVCAAACFLGVLTACGAGKDTETETSAAAKTETAAETAAAEPSAPAEGSAAAGTSADEAAAGLMSELTAAIEAQYPEQSFSDLEDLDGKLGGLYYRGDYVFGGRSSSTGWQYIAGICKTSDNPLEGLSCGTAPAVAGFGMSQFDGGQVLLMENGGGEDTGLSFLFDVLQQGKEGVHDLTAAVSRGVRLIPPEAGAFLKVSAVKEGTPVTEFIPLTKEEKETLQNGTPLQEEADGPVRGLAFCENREALSAVWNGSGENLTEEMLALAGEKSGFREAGLSEIQDLSKAALRVSVHGESRTETVENQEDLTSIEALLKSASRDAYQPSGRYDGALTLTNRDGSEAEVQLSSDGSGFVLGNSVLYSLSAEDTQRLWSFFTTIEGFRKYGDSVSLRMTKPEFTAEEENLTFTLFNDTGKPIQYILSPNLYKKEGEEWKWMENIAGYCGFVSSMEGEELSLSIPWKDAFALDGAGTYRVAFTVMPEPELRFDVSDTFQLIN